METRREECLLRQNEELRDLLEDVLLRVQEIREELTLSLEDLEDQISEAQASSADGCV